MKRSNFNRLCFSEIALILIVITISLTNCERKQTATTTVPMNWQPVDSINANLPDGVRLFAGKNDSLPLNAWYVSVDLKRENIKADVVMSDDTTDNRETVASFASDLGACVVVNAGYFQMNEVPSSHVGLLLCNDSLISPATHSVNRGAQTYPVARAAIGWNKEEQIDVAWVSTRNDTVFQWRQPRQNVPDQPAAYFNFNRAKVWKVSDAVSAGPALVENGSMNITSDQEVFFGTSIPKTHPRTAAGYSKEGELILLVVDGRYPESRGVNLEELAQLMIDLGAVEALNLDGGGSSTLVVNNTLINRPEGKTFQREVVSAIAVYCE